MTAPEHLTITGPEDILGFIPHSPGLLAGQQPRGHDHAGQTARSHAPGGPARSGDPARPARTSPGTVAPATCRRTTTPTAPCWCSSPTTAGRRRPPAESGPGGVGRPLLDALETALGLAGMPVRDAWYVGDEYWRNAYCTDAGCCPLPGPARRRDPGQPAQRRDGVPGQQRRGRRPVTAPARPDRAAARRIRRC